MNVWLKGLPVLAVVGLLLAGCEGVLPEKDEPPVEDRSASVPDRGTGSTASGAGSGTTQALPGRGGFEGHPLDDPASLLAQRVVYFDFDSSEIHPEDRPVVEAHAEFLADNPSAVVVLEGHADERGSREYNIGLGERRAQSVLRLVSLLGAADRQLRTVSFGEERPADPGHDEAAWAKNRRVEFNYVAR